jgi:N-6 DNA Methylase
MARDPETLAHLEWLGYVQPVGLVVSIPALLTAQAHVGRISPAEHLAFLSCLPIEKDGEVLPEISDFGKFVHSVLGWEASDLQAPPTSLEVALPEYHETLRPTFVVPEFQPKNADRPWLLLVQCLPKATNCDVVNVHEDRNWPATPQARFERLLRETEVPVGLLFNHTQLRLVYAPRGETSGYATFSVADMAAVAGRPIFAALQMLLSAERLFSLPEKQRLPAILADSRKYQNVVSTQLAEQVLAALYELLRGFQAADDAVKNQLLHDVLARDPNHVYAGLLTVLMRLVFILYAEDRGLLSTDSVYVNYYSVTGLFDRLRADAGRFPDTMNHRYGAWAQLLTLFRLIHEGGSHADFHIPARKGYLFDPERYPFLEGRSVSSAAEGVSIPRVSDGVLFQVLSNLLILDGERLSYRTLDVEQIGSVYETIMGFNLEVARGRSIAIKSVKPHGAPSTINLEELLPAKPAERAKWLLELSDQKLAGQAADALKKAATIDDLLAALDKKIAHKVTPNVVSKGAMVLQPSDERRRSGSHYTPRSLTAPIVRKTLEPILKRLGASPTPQQILDLKICDPAMGSAAFLVETCRQLGDVLVKAWRLHKQMPRIPPDEDEVLHARRLIAQRCLYGVDKNAMAVDLAKLSLWLATLAKDHPFTFLDHALRHGDSLVGLTREQIAGFHWKPAPQRAFDQKVIEERIQAATRIRQVIIEAGDDVLFSYKEQQLALAEEALNTVRFAGNLAVAVFFAEDNDRKRQTRRENLLGQLTEYLKTGDMTKRPTAAEAELLAGPKGVHPFHWEIEFPEVFGRENGGFDAMAGNPPFAGKNTIIEGQAGGYLDWLKAVHSESHGNADLVAHFFRRAFTLLRSCGTFGLIATNTIAQGDTRGTGLRWICTHGGTIYAGRRRYKWPGQAAVMVSIVHIGKGFLPGPFELDGKMVSLITAYLFHAGGRENPATLISNAGNSFQGSIVLGMGFTFDDNEKNGVASSLAEMHRLIGKDKRNAQRIFPYIGGEELNDSPTHLHHRYVINFGEMTEDDARKWPDLIGIIENKVRGTRASHSTAPWWQFERLRPELYRAIKGMARVLVIPFVSKWYAPAFVPSSTVVAGPANVVAFDTFASFCVLQSRPHEGWARFFSSSFKDDPRYILSDCFETFPFPENFETDVNLEAMGKDYYEFRAALMVKNNEGLTKTYNRFHDPNETSADIKTLRELHAVMDRAVLDAYGWTDLQPTCEFLLDYEEEEEDDEAGTARRKKKPWRYRWPDEFRDEVLARLLELNKKRAEEERLSGAAAEGKAKKAGKKRRPRLKDEGEGLF